MAALISFLDLFLEDVVAVFTVILELFGIIVLVCVAFRCFVQWVRRDPVNIRLNLAQGIAWHWNSRWAVRCFAPWWSGSGQSWEFWAQSSCCGLC
ncbi:MAG: hypothetical protein ACI4OJ_06395 [Lachnospiraceae bacterium]